MISKAELNATYMVELHLKGGSQIRPTREVMQDHLACILNGEKPDWIAVAVRPDFMEAQRELGRIRKEIRERKKEKEPQDV
jgi:hypothetical protein